MAELAALRKSGKKTFDSYEVKDVEDLYEEVDEDQYKTIVRDRLNEDDFVVDDNGEGYADDGREDWDRPQVYESDSEEDMPVRGKSTKTCESYEAPPVLDDCLIKGNKPRKNNETPTRPSKMPQITTSANSSPKVPSRRSPRLRYEACPLVAIRPELTSSPGCEDGRGRPVPG